MIPTPQREIRLIAQQDISVVTHGAASGLKWRIWGDFDTTRRMPATLYYGNQSEMRVREAPITWNHPRRATYGEAEITKETTSWVFQWRTGDEVTGQLRIPGSGEDESMVRIDGTPTGRTAVHTKYSWFDRRLARDVDGSFEDLVDANVVRCWRDEIRIPRDECVAYQPKIRWTRYLSISGGPFR
jgi:hypothetical protein